jgi:hypothetical protein
MQIKQVVGEIKINETNKLVINVTHFKVKDKLDMRNWFLSPETGEWLPTQRGFTIELKEIPNLIRLLGLIDIPKEEIKV